MPMSRSAERRSSWAHGLRAAAGDVARACRSLAASPLFAAVAVLSMGLAIGVNATVFSFVDVLLLRPVPLPDVNRLVSVREASRTDSALVRSTSYATFEQWRLLATDVMDVAAMQPMTVRISHGGETERRTGARASWNLFPVLGVPPARGRGFVADDELPGSAPVVLLSDALWQERYGGQDVVGQSITIDGTPHTVVGIMPRDLSHVALRRTLRGAQVWLPLPRSAAGSNDDRALTILARVRDDVVREVAGARLDTIARALEAGEPAEAADWRVTVEPVAVGFSPTTRAMLAAAMGAVAFLLLIVCANLASLTLKRTVARRREIATRLALGASRGRVVGQLFSETVVLVASSLPVGLLTAYGVRGLALRGDSDVAGVVGPFDIRVLMFTGGVTVLASVLTGLIPALLAVRSSRVSALVAGNRSRGAAGPEHSRVSSALVIVEVALAVTLLVGASLFARSFQAMLEQDGTFDTSPLVMVSVAGSGDGNAGPAAGDPLVVAQFIQRLSGLPGVSSVAATSAVPLRTAGTRTPIVTTDGEAISEPTTVYTTAVTARFFDALQVPIAEGRMFSESEVAGGEPVAVVNATLARGVWQGGSAIGQRFRTADGSGPWLTVVGVADDVVSLDVSHEPLPTIYVPYGRVVAAEPNLVVRTDGDPSSLLRSARDVILAVDPELTVRATTMTAVHYAGLSRSRTLAWLFSLVGGVALTLAAFGVYGVLSYFVTERTYEIGVRAALGADRQALIGHFLMHGMKMLAVGAVAGTIGAWGLARVVRGALYGATADSIGIAGVILLIAVVGAAAAWFPARRAAMVDPLVAMRES